MEENRVMLSNWELDKLNQAINFFLGNLKETQDECKKSEATGITNLVAGIANLEVENFEALQKKLVAVRKHTEPETQIEIVWSIEDVLEVRPDLNSGKAMQVLKRAKDCHNAEIGINWEVLETVAHDLFPNEQWEDDTADNSDNKITVDKNGEWICKCGNVSCYDGFSPCDLQGNEVEPIEGVWDGKHYKCERCGAIVNQETLEYEVIDVG
jgi:hypothetical protein